MSVKSYALMISLRVHKSQGHFVTRDSLIFLIPRKHEAKKTIQLII